jgi:uncharacterized membrane protein
VSAVPEADDRKDSYGRFGRDESEFDRAVGFFDATYALALTLLVTTLDVEGDAATWANLGSLDDVIGSQFVAFLISFVVIAGFWLKNHRLLSSAAAIDTPLIVLNLALVLTVVLLPFSTEALGSGAVDDLPLPTAVYAVNIACASLLATLNYVVARRRGLLRYGTDPVTARGVLLVGLLVTVVFLASVPVAYYGSPEAARWSWLSLIVLVRLVPFVSRWRADGTPRR